MFIKKTSLPPKLSAVQRQIDRATTHAQISYIYVSGHRTRVRSRRHAETDARRRSRGPSTGHEDMWDDMYLSDDSSAQCGIPGVPYRRDLHAVYASHRVRDRSYPDYVHDNTGHQQGQLRLGFLR